MLQPPGQLLPIPEAPASHPESAGGIGRQNSGKMRGNLFRGLKRVAQAVKSAASSSTVGDGSGGLMRSGSSLLAYPDGHAQAVSPRQRSMTQQSRAISPMVRVFSEHQNVSRSIDLPRGQTNPSDTSAALQEQGSQMGPAPAARLKRGSTTVHKSPAPSTASIHGSTPTMRVGALSYDAGRLACESAGLAAQQQHDRDSVPLTARSADAIHGATAPLSRPSAFTLYPQQRDRSMTLPSNGSAAAAQTPPAPPPKLAIMSQPVSPLTPGKIDLDISGSPLFKPAASESLEHHSAGERIHKQAVRNISMADMTSEFDAGRQSIMLPPPAVGHRASEGDAAREALTEVAVDPQHASVMISSDKLKHYLQQVAESESKDAQAAPMPENDSGVLVDESGERVSELGRADAAPALSSSAHSQGLSTSHSSLPTIRQQPLSMESPPSPFSFGHSRYSLINQDGSLNLISYEFDKLDGYQKRLSNSTSSLNGSGGGGSGGYGEAKIAERMSRKHGGDASGFWGALASSDVLASVDLGSRHGKLVRKGRGKQADASGASDSGVPHSGRAAHGRNLSVSTTHSALSAGGGGGGGGGGALLPRSSESSSGSGSAGSRQAPRTQQQSQYQMSTPITLLYRQASEHNPVVDSRLLRPTPGINPFDQVYYSTIASMSLEQALTLVEGTTAGDATGAGAHAASGASAASPRHRRLHKRSASVLNEAELDDIMIQTAEMCHSVQTAIKLQQASESGLGRWVSGALGDVGAGLAAAAGCSAPPPPAADMDTEAVSEASGSSARAPSEDSSRSFHCRVPSSSQASSVGMWALGPEQRSAANSLDQGRCGQQQLAGTVAGGGNDSSQDSIGVVDPVAVPTTPRRGSR
ncbi:hypothetical protein GGI02_000250 [Coemansia sp. RSA 2322]|nr:hypothetical protein GGI02_000250 [Coemansia sp. RSA 2322]